MRMSSNLAVDGMPANSSSITAARRVLDTEIKGLAELAEGLDESFDAAVEQIAATKGRVVVSGMGKSGHIGRKIAATLASTGTPAFFVHPGEASHGDLGMIGDKDTVIAISNSGETAELADIIAYCRRHAIALIGITSKPGSSLGERANILLLLPRAKEACPMGLAPTTSTTMTLALGDALAVALLERRGFTSDDYGRFHPGGALGKRLMRVDEIMQKIEKVPLVGPADRMRGVVAAITAGKLGIAGVVDPGGRLMGIITDGDLRRHIGMDLDAATAEEVMTANPKTIRPGQLAQEAAKLMNDKSITSLFVLNGEGRPEGLIHLHDCLRAGIA
jgi:arabinose-5-phosphate isomerase